MSEIRLIDTNEVPSAYSVPDNKGRRSHALHRNAPKLPVIAGDILTAGEMTFVEFLFDPACDRYCELLGGDSGTCLHTIVDDFRKATERYYFGVKVGKLDAPHSATKKLLKDYARHAYRGSTDRLGVKFWQRMAALLWDIYEGLMSLRRKTAAIERQAASRTH